MNLKNTAVVLLTALMLLPSGNLDAKITLKKKSKAKTEEVAKPKPKKPTPYKKLMKEVADSACGDFVNLYITKKEKIYFGYKVANMGRTILAGAAISSVSDPELVMIGQKVATPTPIRFSLQDTTVTVSMPSRMGSFQPGFEKAAERNFIDDVLFKSPVAAWSKDSTMVYFEVTPLVKKFAPKGRGIALTKSSNEEKTQWYGDLKSFKDNASLRLYANIELFKTIIGIKIPIGEASISTTISFLLLPEEPMKPRLQDSRIGIFSTGAKIEIGGEKDGLRKYYFANRWRVEPQDMEAWEAGQKVEVKKPIVWYYDDSFPENWKESIKKAVLVWNDAFEAIGLVNVMQAYEFPSKEEDPEFDPDNLKYSCIRYVPCTTMNAQGPSWVDPSTGEILTASVLVYNDVIRLVNYWRFVQTAQLDERVRAAKLPQDVVEESLVYVISHEIGHTLGFMHNMSASAAYPVEKLRDPEFTQKYGTTPCIMDYARFNYVAQPQDKGVKLTPPTLGVYDYFTIEWLYKPVPGAKDMWEESAIASRMLDEKDGDPIYRYGEQQLGGTTYGEYDPSSRNEDLGDDPILAGTYGVKNLQYNLSHLNEWIEGDEDYSHREALYGQMVGQFKRYLGHTMSQIGGIYLYQVKENSAHKPSEPVSKSVQKKSLKWAVDQVKNASWLDNKEVTGHIRLQVSQACNVATYVGSYLATTAPKNVVLCSAVEDPAKAYTVKEYYGDLYNEVFASSIAGKTLSAQEKALQRSLFTKVATPYLKAAKKLTDEQLYQEALENAEEPCFETGLGEGRPNYQKVVAVADVDESTAYGQEFLIRIQKLTRGLRNSAPAADRAHYEYIYRTACQALGE